MMKCYYCGKAAHNRHREVPVCPNCWPKKERDTVPVPSIKVQGTMPDYGSDMKYYGMSFHTVSGEELDRWGKMMGVDRHYAETEVEYRERVQKKFLANRDHLLLA